MNNRLKGNLLVLGQFILLGALIFYPASSIATGSFSYLLSLISLTSLFLGFVILAVSGLALGKSLTAHPIPGKNAQLVTSGLYKFVRHPIYSGLILLGFGLSISGGFFPHLIFFAALLFLLNYKAKFEEQLLLARYPGYAAYSAKTGRFLPRLIR